jgi:chromosome segregation ATPase
MINPMKNEKESSPSAVSLLLLLLILVTAGVIILKDKAEIEQLKQKQAALSENIEVRDSLTNDMLTTFGEVEQNLTFLRDKRSEIMLVSQNEGRQRQKMLISDVVLMNKMLVSGSRKLDDLNNLYNTSDFENELLKNEIAQLNKLIDTYKIYIQQLKTEVDQRDSELTQIDIPVFQIKTENDLTSVSTQTKETILSRKNTIDSD